MSRRIMTLLTASVVALLVSVSPAHAADREPANQPSGLCPLSAWHDRQDTTTAAYPTWYLETVTCLSNSPSDSMATAYQRGRVNLLYGGHYYDWGRTWNGDKHLMWDNVYLVGGWYTAEVWLDPENGYYYQTIRLTPDDPKLTWVETSESIYVQGGSNNVTWGTYLDPQF